MKLFIILLIAQITLSFGFEDSNRKVCICDVSVPPVEHDHDDFTTKRPQTTSFVNATTTGSPVNTTVNPNTAMSNSVNTTMVTTRDGVTATQNVRNDTTENTADWNNTTTVNKSTTSMRQVHEEEDEGIDDEDLVGTKNFFILKMQTDEFHYFHSEGTGIFHKGPKKCTMIETHMDGYDIVSFKCKTDKFCACTLLKMSFNETGPVDPLQIPPHVPMVPGIIQANVMGDGIIKSMCLDYMKILLWKNPELLMSSVELGSRRFKIDTAKMGKNCHVFPIHRSTAQKPPHDNRYSTRAEMTYV